MGKSVEARIKALAEEIRRRQWDHEGPTDPLSKSLFETERELLGLDEAGKVLLLAELNQVDPESETGLDLTMEDLEKWISDCREGRKFVW